MKKTLYTLNIDNYAPNITALTFPLIKRYAKKIGADFHVIDKRVFPKEYPPVYEKFQIYDLAQQHKNDWNIYFDADTLIHPDFWDVTEIIQKGVTVSNGTDFTPVRFKPDKYFKRDGRFIGKGNWCMIASDWCIDVWKPLDDITYDEAVKNITTTATEAATVITPEHLIDDYVVSRNIAKYGLKHVLIPKLSEECKIRVGMLWHQYLVDIKRKEKEMKKHLMFWAAEALLAELGQQAVQVVNPWNGTPEWDEYMSASPIASRFIPILKSWGMKID